MKEKVLKTNQDDPYKMGGDKPYPHTIPKRG
jgi:hypothetical protein